MKRYLNKNTSIKEALKALDTTAQKILLVEEDHKLQGVITDGDIRRLLEKSADFIDRPVKDYMTVDPISIAPHRLAAEALQIMEAKEINDLPVVEAEKPVAMLNFQDLLRAKVF